MSDSRKRMSTCILDTSADSSGDIQRAVIFDISTIQGELLFKVNVFDGSIPGLIDPVNTYMIASRSPRHCNLHVMLDPSDSTINIFLGNMLFFVIVPVVELVVSSS